MAGALAFYCFPSSTELKRTLHPFSKCAGKECEIDSVYISIQKAIPLICNQLENRKLTLAQVSGIVDKQFMTEKIEELPIFRLLFSSVLQAAKRCSHGERDF